MKNVFYRSSVQTKLNCHVDNDGQLQIHITPCDVPVILTKGQKVILETDGHELIISAIDVTP